MDSNDCLDDNIIKISEKEYIDIDFLKKVYNISFTDLKNNIDLILINIKEKNTGLLDSNFNLYSHEIVENYKKFFNEYIVKKYYENISCIDKNIIRCQYDFTRIDSFKQLRFFINKRRIKTLNFNLNDFYKNNNLFDIEFYKEKYCNKIFYKNMTDKEIIINYLKNGTLLNHVYSRKLIFIFYVPILDFKIGGHVAVYNAFKQIKSFNNPMYTAKLFTIQQIRFKSHFCDYDDFIDIVDLNKNCIVIYPETVRGNPLGLKHVIRWILLEIGIETQQDTVDTWGENDLILNWQIKNKISNLKEKFDMEKLYKFYNNILENDSSDLIKNLIIKNNKNKNLNEILLPKEYLRNRNNNYDSRFYLENHNYIFNLNLILNDNLKFVFEDKEYNLVKVEPIHEDDLFTKAFFFENDLNFIIICIAWEFCIPYFIYYSDINEIVDVCTDEPSINQKPHIKYNFTMYLKNNNLFNVKFISNKIKDTQIYFALGAMVNLGHYFWQEIFGLIFLMDNNLMKYIKNIIIYDYDCLDFENILKKEYPHLKFIKYESNKEILKDKIVVNFNSTLITNYNSKKFKEIYFKYNKIDDYQENDKKVITFIIRNGLSRNIKNNLEIINYTINYFKKIFDNKVIFYFTGWFFYGKNKSSNIQKNSISKILKIQNEFIESIKLLHPNSKIENKIGFNLKELLNIFRITNFLYDETGSSSMFTNTIFNFKSIWSSHPNVYDDFLNQSKVLNSYENTIPIRKEYLITVDDNSYEIDIEGYKEILDLLDFKSDTCFESETKIKKNYFNEINKKINLTEKKDNDIDKLSELDKSSILRLHYIKNHYKLKNFGKRNGSCYLIKKGRFFHKEIEKYGILIDDLDDESISNIFNECELFYTYDLLTMYIPYALMCGCSVVIIPPEDLSKEEYFANSIFFYNNKILNDGIAFGKNELEFARNTIKYGIKNVNLIFKSELKNFNTKIDEIFTFFSESKSIIDLIKSNNVNLGLVRKFYNLKNYEKGSLINNLKKNKDTNILHFINKALEVNYKFNKIIYLDKDYKENYFFRKIKSVNQLKEYQSNKKFDEYYIYNKESFQERFKFFNFNFYKNKYFPKINMSDEELITDYMLNGIENKYFYSKKIFFVFYVPELNYYIGGIVAIYNLIKLINKQNNPNYCAKIFNIKNKRFESEFNNIDDFITLQEINDNCIVFYPEIITGNPLNSKNTVRWILLKLGIETGNEIKKSWGKNDYIIHWETDNKSRNLRYHYIKKSFFNEKISNRTWTCCLVKKGRLTHSNINTTSYDFILDDILNESQSIKYLFSNKYRKLLDIKILGRDYFKKIKLLTIKKNSWHNNDIDDIIAFYFNRCKLFFTYDIKTMWIVYSLLCGCPVVIIPYKKISKEEFFNESIFNFDGKILNDGIAWGYDEIEFAKKTIDNASDNIFKIFNSEENIALKMIDSIYNKFKLKREKEEFEIENFTSKKFDDIVKKINLIYPKLKIKNDVELEYFFENMEEDNIIEIKKEYLNVIK